MRVFALDPETGVERWEFNPHLGSKSRGGPYPLTCRGVAYWEEKGADGAPAHVRAPHPLRHARLRADRARRRHGLPVRRLRRERPRRAARRDRRGGARLGVLPDLAAARDRRPRRDRRARRRSAQDRCAVGRRARVRRAHGQARVGVGSGAAGLEARSAARGRALPARHAERVGAALGRRRAPARVRAHGQSVARQLRRAAARHRLLRELHGRARCGDGQGGLALPDRAPRHLGLRRAGAAAALPAREGGRRARPRWCNRPSSGTSSCSTARRASRSIQSRSARCRRTARPARRSRPRSRSRPIPRRCTRTSSARTNMFGFTPWDTEVVSRTVRAQPLGRHVHAAHARGLDPISGHARRHQLGRRRARPRARASCSRTRATSRS